MEQEQFWRALQQICDPPADYLNKRARLRYPKRRVNLRRKSFPTKTIEGHRKGQIFLSNHRVSICPIRPNLILLFCP